MNEYKNLYKIYKEKCDKAELQVEDLVKFIKTIGYWDMYKGRDDALTS